MSEMDPGGKLDETEPKVVDNRPRNERARRVTRIYPGRRTEWPEDRCYSCAIRFTRGIKLVGGKPYCAICRRSMA